MLKIASYSLKGQSVRVKLKCTCGEGKIFEVEEEGQRHYFCGKCRSRKTVEELKKEASTYWRGHVWIVDCESDQRAKPRIHVNYAVELTVKATRYSPSYCVLHGELVVLSESGALVVVEDFQEKYFQDVTTTYRYVELAAARAIPTFPSMLTGRVVGVRFRPDELPKSRVGIAFEGLSDEMAEALESHINEHKPNGSSES